MILNVIGVGYFKDERRNKMVGNYIDEATGEVWCIALLQEVRTTNVLLRAILENSKKP